MNYAQTTDEAISVYPYTMALLKAANPLVGFPRTAFASAEIRQEYGVVEVVEVSAPEGTFAETTPTLVDGQWQQTWVRTQKSFDEAIDELRSQRNRLLASSDWTQVADVALTVEQDTSYRNYRKALRDLPAGLRTADDVASVAWPTV